MCVMVCVCVSTLCMSYCVFVCYSVYIIVCVCFLSLLIRASALAEKGLEWGVEGGRDLCLNFTLVSCQLWPWTTLGILSSGS